MLLEIKKENTNDDLLKMLLEIKKENTRLATRITVIEKKIDQIHHHTQITSGRVERASRAWHDNECIKPLCIGTILIFLMLLGLLIETGLQGAYLHGHIRDLDNYIQSKTNDTR